jgi:hypothetical protein
LKSEERQNEMKELISLGSRSTTGSMDTFIKSPAHFTAHCAHRPMGMGITSKAKTQRTFMEELYLQLALDKVDQEK